MTFIYFIINNYFDNFTAFELIDYELIEHTIFRYFNILSFILYYHRYQNIDVTISNVINKVTCKIIHRYNKFLNFSF